MSFVDKSLTCFDCGAAFTFTATEQEFFAEKGYTNEPKRCQTCRAARKSQNGTSSGFGQSSRRQMYPATCSQCGQATQLPFEPKNGRPVYCRDCYSKVNTRGPRY